jgi:hypothetical protein
MFIEEAEAVRRERVSEARSRAERQRNAAGRRQPERAQRNETVFSHFTYDITYDITTYDIIVGVMISLVICDIMFYHMIS